MELSTSPAGEGRNRGAMKYFEELYGAANFLKVHRDGCKSFLNYSTSNMCVNTMAQQHNGGGKIILHV